MNYETNDRIITTILYSYNALHTRYDAHLKQLYIDIMHTDLALCNYTDCRLVLQRNLSINLYRKQFLYSGDSLSWTHFVRLCVYTTLVRCIYIFCS